MLFVINMNFYPSHFFVVKYLNLTVNLKNWPLVFSNLLLNFMQNFAEKNVFTLINLSKYWNRASYCRANRTRFFVLSVKPRPVLKLFE